MNQQDELRELAIANVVDQIDGISERVLDNLEAEFGTAEAIGNAGVNELKRVDGVGTALARKIYRKTNSAKRHPSIHLGEEPKRRIRR